MQFCCIMNNQRNIKAFITRLGVVALLSLFLLITFVYFFHSHEKGHIHHSEHCQEETQSVNGECHICNYFLHKHSAEFILSDYPNFVSHQVFITELTYETDFSQSRLLYHRVSNKAPPHL